MRRREPVKPAADAPPAELLTPTVEVYVTASEITSHTFASSCPACALRRQTWHRGDCSQALKLLAHRRWRQTRQAWLDEHAVPRREHGSRWPTSAPRWSKPPPSNQTGAWSLQTLRHQLLQ